MIQENITDLQKAAMFSVQLDTTQNITAQEQCTVILKYVTDNVNESKVAVVRCSISTGKSSVQVLTEVLEHLKLDTSVCHR